MSNVDVTAVHHILRRIKAPWSTMPAYTMGLIDENGNPLKSSNDMTLQESLAYPLLDRAIYNFKRARDLPALAIMHEQVGARYNRETADFLLERMAEYGMIGKIKHDLSTAEGYLAAMEEYLMKEMTLSGASFGGGFSGAGDNATINATGRAGVDPVMNLKNKFVRRKINKFIGI